MIRKLNCIVKDIFFPAPLHCLVCGNALSAGQEYFCQACYEKIWRIEPPYCQRCGRPLGDLLFCQQCCDENFFVNSVRSWGVYSGVLRQAIHLFKFAGHIYLGEWFAKHMLQDLDILKHLHSWVLVPVPLHPRRLLLRGFNQAEVLCAALAKHSSQKYVNMLYRLTNTPPQTTLNRQERLVSVKNKFGVKKRVAKAYRGQKILLVDDVMTTGSTLNECGRALKQCGFQEIKALTIATVLKP